VDGKRGRVGENCYSLFKMFFKISCSDKQVVGLPQSKIIKNFLPVVGAGVAQSV
jgi:hypothetical protein